MIRRFLYGIYTVTILLILSKIMIHLQNETFTLTSTQSLKSDSNLEVFDVTWNLNDYFYIKI